MRLVLACALLAGCLASAAEQPSRPRIMLALQFDSIASDNSVEEMKRELESIMQQAGITFDYKLRSELNETDTPSDIIVVKFHGRCRMENLPPLLDERGPFAITRVTDGTILPYSEVACDRVRVSVRSAMSGNDYDRGDVLLGRALGRVLAHEIYHILAKTPHHGTGGVAKTSLSGRQLITSQLRLESADIKLLLR